MSRGRAGLDAMVRLRNGVEIPCVGLGTYKAQGDEAREAVLFSLRKGIRHIDTASIYLNHAEVAAAIRESGVPREELFITSKISPFQQGTVKAEEAFNRALEELGVDYLDLMLIHWPGASRIPLTSPKHAEVRLESWRVLERKHREGLVRAIGVSNFLQHHLEHLINAADVTPMINQVEIHPRFPQTALRRFCVQSSIVVEAYSSLGCGELLDHPVVQQVAARVGRSASQVLLRWGLQNDCIVLPKSVTPERIRLFAPPEQLTSSSWSLDTGSMRDLDALDDGTKFCWDPSVVTF